MDYISVTGQTWTKISDASTDTMIVQGQRPTPFQWSLGEPNAGESGFFETNQLVLNAGTYSEELWVYTVDDTTFVVWGAV